MKESSDNRNQPRKLEEVFRDGFEPAEVSPSDKLWSRIEQELEVKQVSYYKRHLAWYRGIAAASILLLMLAMSYFWYDTKTAHQVAFRTQSDSTNLYSNNNLAKSAASLPDTIKSNLVDIVKQKSNSINTRREKIALSSDSTEHLPNLANKGTDPLKFAAARKLGTKYNTTGFSLPDSRKVKGPAGTTADDTSKNQQKENVVAINQDLALPGNDSIQISTGKYAGEILNNINKKSSSSDTAQHVALSPLVDTLQTFTASVAKHEPEQKKKISRWAIGGGTGSQYFKQNIEFSNATPNTFYNSPASGFTNNVAPISRNLSGNTIEAAKEEFNRNTHSAFSYRASMSVNYKINQSWSLEGGLTFTENQAQTSTSYIIYKRPGSLYNLAYAKPQSFSLADKSVSVPSNVNIPVTIFLAELTDSNLDNTNVTIDKVDPFNMNYRYRQVGLPVKLRYQKNKGKWFTFIQAGGAVNMLVQTSIISESARIPDVNFNFSQASPFRQWYFTGLGSLGRGLKISEVWQVQGSLDVARSFSELTQALTPAESGKNKPYHLGFGVSTSYVVGRKAINQN